MQIVSFRELALPGRLPKPGAHRKAIASGKEQQETCIDWRPLGNANLSTLEGTYLHVLSPCHSCSVLSLTLCYRMTQKFCRHAHAIIKKKKCALHAENFRSFSVCIFIRQNKSVCAPGVLTYLFEEYSGCSQAKLVSSLQTAGLTRVCLQETNLVHVGELCHG